MKKALKLLGAILVMTVMLASCDAFAVGNTFTFSARPSSMEIREGEPFQVTVTTENTSGADYLYRGSSRIVGALAYLVTEVDGAKVTVMPSAVPITNDYRETVIKAGEKIVFTWEFGEYEKLSQGEYDLHLEFEGETKVLENFVTVS